MVTYTTHLRGNYRVSANAQTDVFTYSK